MSITIKSPSSGTTAEVNEKQQLEVSASVSSESHHVSLNNGETYLWTTSWSADTGEEVIYLKNNSKTKYLIIDKVTVSAVAASLFELYTATGTAAGTTITGANANRASGNAADASAFGEAEVTGLTTASRIDMARVAANGRATMDLQDVLILGQNDAITLTYTGSTGIVDVIITGYFEDK